jgi:hypothetical protein
MTSAPATTPRQPDLLTTRAAAAYLGYRSPSSLRKAAFDGKVSPVGRRGGGGPLVWRVSDLDEFLIGRAPQSRGTRRGRAGR